MTGSKEKKKTNQMLAQDRARVIGESSSFQKDLASRVGQADEQSGASRSALEGALGGMSGGNYRVNADFGEARDLYRGFTKTGGIDENKARVAHPIFQDIANNQDIANRYRAGGTFEEFSKTGGISEADRANIRSRATSVIPAYYQQMRNEAQRAQALQGGYGPGVGALQSRLARDQAAQAQAAARDAELGIMQQVREGRMFGATGMSQAEHALQGTRLGAGQALDVSERDIQAMLQRGKMFGTSGIHNISSEEAAIEAANMDRAAGIDMGVLGMRGDLAEGDRAQQNFLMNAGLANRGLTYQSLSSGVDQRMQNNPQRDWLGMLIGGASTAAGAYLGRPPVPR